MRILTQFCITFVFEGKEYGTWAGKIVKNAQVWGTYRSEFSSQYIFLYKKDGGDLLF